MKKKQVLLGGFLAVLALAMLSGIAAIVLPQRFVSEEVIFTIMLVGCYALGILMVIAVGRDMRVTMQLATISAVISMLTFVALIWLNQYFGYRYDDILIKLGLATLIIALALLHRLLIVPLDPRMFWGRLSKRVALIGAGMTGGCFIAFLVLEDYVFGEDLIIRILGIGLLATAGASIAIGAISLFGPRPGEGEPDVVAESIPVRLTCPVCEDQIEAMSNTAGHCGRCKLQIEIRTRELRCLCGYLLHKLERDICPECGTPVEAGQRWEPASRA